MLCPLLKIGTLTFAVTEYVSFLSTVLEESRSLPTEPETENSGAKFKLFFFISSLEFFS